jgi:glycosyltransferase involved in cell wall biosynthesis
MRVGVLMTRPPAERGGGHTFEHDIFDALIRRAKESSHRFVVLSPVSRELAAAAPQNVEMPMAMPARVGRIVRAVPQWLWVKRVVSASKVDVVWALSPDHAMPDVPFITVVWDLEHRVHPFFPEVSAGWQWTLRERQFAQRVRRAMVTVTGTAVGKSEIVRIYQVAEERVRVVPLPTPRFALESVAGDDGTAIRAKYGLADRYLFYPAQFWPHKNHANLLLALHELRARHGSTMQLVLVGSDAGNRSHVEEMIERLGLKGQVKMLGFLPVEELAELYRRAFALSYVSLFGPDNLPPLEAFALGCPVIAADGAGAAEQLGDAALRIDALQPSAIAAAVQSLVDDDGLRATLIERGRRRASRWTGDDYVRAVFAILDEHAATIRCWRP